MGKGRWSQVEIAAHVRAWKESGLTSEQYVQVRAPELPARTLRHHRQRIQAQLEIEMGELCAENAALKLKLSDFSACLPATTAEAVEKCLVPDAIAAPAPDASCHAATGDPPLVAGWQQPKVSVSPSPQEHRDFFWDWPVDED